MAFFDELAASSRNGRSLIHADVTFTLPDGKLAAKAAKAAQG